jgi:hypothetical protein
VTCDTQDQETWFRRPGRIFAHPRAGKGREAEAVRQRLEPVLPREVSPARQALGARIAGGDECPGTRAGLPQQALQRSVVLPYAQRDGAAGGVNPVGSRAIRGVKCSGHALAREECSTPDGNALTPVRQRRSVRDPHELPGEGPQLAGERQSSECGQTPTRSPRRSDAVRGGTRMSYLARGPSLLGIDSQANAVRLRRAHRGAPTPFGEEASRVGRSANPPPWL